MFLLQDCFLRERDLPLIKKWRLRQPLFLSTGMATLARVGQAVRAARKRMRDLILLNVPVHSSRPEKHSGPSPIYGAFRLPGRGLRSYSGIGVYRSGSFGRDGGQAFHIEPG